MRISNISGGSVVINNVAYRGQKVSVVNGVVTVDGVQQGDLKSSPQITVHIQGDVGSVRLEAGTITVEGNVLGDLNMRSSKRQCKDNVGRCKTPLNQIRRC